MTRRSGLNAHTHSYAHSYTRTSNSGADRRPQGIDESTPCEYCDGTYGDHQLDEDGEPCILACIMDRPCRDEHIPRNQPRPRYRNLTD